MRSEQIAVEIWNILNEERLGNLLGIYIPS